MKHVQRLNKRKREQRGDIFVADILEKTKRNKKLRMHHLAFTFMSSYIIFADNKFSFTKWKFIHIILLVSIYCTMSGWGCSSGGLRAAAVFARQVRGFENACELRFTAAFIQWAHRKRMWGGGTHMKNILCNQRMRWKTYIYYIIWSYICLHSILHL